MKTSKNNTTTWYVDNINGVRQSITYNEEVWEHINLNEVVEDKKIKNNKQKQNIKKINVVQNVVQFYKNISKE